MHGSNVGLFVRVVVRKHESWPRFHTVRTKHGLMTCFRTFDRKRKRTDNLVYPIANFAKVLKAGLRHVIDLFHHGFLKPRSQFLLK